MFKHTLTAVVVFTISVSAFAAPNMCGELFAETKKGPAPSVVVISGTNRDGSNSLKVAETMRDLLAEEGADVQILDLALVPPSTYSSTNYFNTPKSFQKKFDGPITKAQSIVIVVPEYHGSFPGILKTFFDYVQAPLAGKSVTFIGVSAGKWGARSALASLAETFVHRKASVPGTSRINIENVDDKMDGTRVSDPSTRDRMQAAAREIVAGLEVQADNIVPLEKLQKLATLEVSSEVSLNSGLVVSGTLANVIVKGKSDSPAYLQFSGPTRLKDQARVHQGQDTNAHPTGFGTPLGALKNGTRLSTVKAVADLGLKAGESATLEFKSGVVVTGTFVKTQSSHSGQLQIITWENCTVTLDGKILFDPSWGTFDMAVGETVVQVKM